MSTNCIKCGRRDSRVVASMYCVRCMLPPDELNRCNGVIICDLCLDGAGGECHTPGCVMWQSSAPDLPLRRRIAAENGTVEPWPDTAAP